MKKLIIIILFTIATQLNAQNIQKKFDFKFGVGISFLETVNMATINFENEINYQISQYFSTSFTLNYGRSNFGVDKTSSYIQGNLNIFISPFKKNRKNNFRIGSGVSIMNISDSYHYTQVCAVGIEQTPPYHFDKRNSSGFNIIIEDTYSIKDRYLIGMKFFIQPYINGDLNSRVLLKFGFKL